jgi:hypothetical protein
MILSTLISRSFRRSTPPETLACAKRNISVAGSAGLRTTAFVSATLRPSPLTSTGPAGKATSSELAAMLAAAICAISDDAPWATAARDFKASATPSRRRFTPVEAGAADDPPRVAASARTSRTASCQARRSAPWRAARPAIDTCAAPASMRSAASFCASDSFSPPMASLRRSRPSAPLSAFSPAKVVCGFSIPRSKRPSAMRMAIFPAATSPSGKARVSAPLLSRAPLSDSLGCASSTRVPAAANSIAGDVSTASAATSMASAFAGSA